MVKSEAPHETVRDAYAGEEFSIASCSSCGHKELFEGGRRTLVLLRALGVTEDSWTFHKVENEDGETLNGFCPECSPSEGEASSQIYTFETK